VFLSGLIPIPEYDTEMIWILKNKIVPPPKYSHGLGVSPTCEVLSQEETDIMGVS
jgi:hypothetical protein